MRRFFKEKLKINNMFKVMVLVTVIALGAGVTLYNVLASENAPETIKVSTTYSIPKYISGMNIGMITSEDGVYSYCMDHNKRFPSGDVMTRDKELDAGFGYILQNGYPTKSITGDSKKDYYITQMTIWWYLDDTTGSTNLSNAVKNTNPDPYGIRPHVKKLLAGAHAARKEGYKKPTISASISSTTMKLEGKNYVSEDITVNSTGLDGKYSVYATGVEGVKVTDTAGNIKTVFNTNEKFRISVSKDKMTDSSSISVEIKGVGNVAKAYQYKPDVATTQRMTPFTLYKTPVEVKTSLNLGVQTAKMTILKLDADTNQPLAGAEFKLYDANNNVVASWTSTESGQDISNLAPGKYKLKEISAPDGYNMLEEAIDVTVELNKENKVIVYNKKQEPTEVIIIKRDSETGETLAGATLALKNSKGEIVATWETTNKGHRFQKLPEGEYTVIELAAPAGYEKSDEEIKVTLKAGEVATVNFYNKKKPDTPTKVRISKRDITNEKELPGAHLVIKDANGNIVEEWVSTDEPHYIEGLKEGKYTLEETSAPDGYVLYTEKIEFELYADGTVQEVVMYNTPETPVPPTDEYMSKMALVAGLSIMILGLGIVYNNAKKEENY